MLEITELLIPLAGIFFGTTMWVAIVWLILRFKSERNRLAYEAAVKLAEHGQPVPAELFTRTHSNTSDLRRGVTLIMFGIALSIGLYQIDAPWSFGLIPTLMGVGYLIVWQFEKRDQAKVT